MIEDLQLFLKNTLFYKDMEINKLLSSDEYCLISVNRLDSQIELLQIILFYIDDLEKSNKEINKK